MSYNDFKNQVSSEKITLAILHASKRLMAWTLHSGSIYKLTNFDVASIVSIEDSGTAYTEVQSIAAVTASKFYNDRENKILYLRTTGSDNPNGRFLALTYKLFFADAPVTLPHDLSTGYDVYWEPMIKGTSAFGVEIDTINQTSEAIEGSGTLTLFNDQDFWPSNFDKLVFENKPCYIYSYNRELEASEAQLIFRGLVEKRSYDSDKISFSLKDLLAELKASISLSNIEDLGLRTATNLAKAKQRMIFGRVYGHRPVNTDEVLTGYPLSGTISISIGSDTVTGSGTSFLAKLSPDDTVVLDGNDYTIATVVSDTSLTLTEVYSGATNLSGASASVKPAEPKRYMNRTWCVAGHALRQPTTTIQAGSSITRIIVESTKDIYDGDWVYVGTLGSGELVRVNQVLSSTLLTLSLSLETIPAIGTVLFKPAVQNVRLDDVLLTYYQDYTFDPDTAVLTLSNDAELNAAPLKQMPTNLAFTNTSRTVTGTSLTALKPGTMISCVGHADYFEVLSIDSETSLTLRTAATFTDADKGLYKTYIFEPGSSVLTCDVLGRTDDGTSSGALINTAPAIVEQLLVDLGLSDVINTDSFTEAKDIAYQPIGMVIPTRYNDTKVPTYREAFNKINQSVFGSVVQTRAFEFSYLVLQPFKDTEALRLDEADILKLKISSTSDKVIKTAIVTYKPVEYNYLTKQESISTQQKTSDNANYLIKVDREKTFPTVLCDSADAERQANRWSFVLENAANSINVSTKLQGISLEVGSIVDISHRKLYSRLTSSSTRKLALVESVKKSGTGVDVELVDLSNMFNRVGAITDISTVWSDTDEDGRLYGGFITDEYGLIDDDPDSWGTNLIW